MLSAPASEDANGLHVVNKSIVSVQIGSRSTFIQTKFVKQTWFYCEILLIFPLHFCSSTTTSEVIRALLQKFKITDNPRKFALYEKIFEADKCK